MDGDMICEWCKQETVNPHTFFLDCVAALKKRLVARDAKIDKLTKQIKDLQSSMATADTDQWPLFERWYNVQENHWQCTQYTEKEIAYSAWCAATAFASPIHAEGDV